MGRAQAWALSAGRAGVLQARGARSAQAGERQARGARGLAAGCELGPFSIRFDSFFFLSHQMNTVHCKIKIF